MQRGYDALTIGPARLRRQRDPPWSSPPRGNANKLKSYTLACSRPGPRTGLVAVVDSSDHRREERTALTSHARWNSVTDEMEVTFEIGPADGPNKYTYGGVDEAA